jgi:hypothetical protein
MPNECDDPLSKEEIERRREAALKKMLSTPPKPFTPKAKASQKQPKQRIIRHQDH